MRITACVIVFSFLLSTAISAPLKVKEISKTMFFGDDFHIELPSRVAEVTFQPSGRLPEVPMMREGIVVSTRAKLNLHLSHLILDDVAEADEGVYTVKDQNDPDSVQRISLIVRDCSNDQNVKYGDNFHIQLQGVSSQITLEYRPSAVEANQTSRPALVLLTSSREAREGYQGRLSVNEHHVTLSAVTGADEGSYTVRDAGGYIKRKLCLNVKEHQNFVRLPYSGTLKMNLILNSSLIRLYYTPSSASEPRLLMDKGELTSAQSEVGLEGRLSVDGSVVILEQVKGADAGHFLITDILGFTVSNIYLDVEPYRLPSVYVAVIALLGLLVFLLLVCLLSCLFKVKKRAKRAAALEKIAQNAGKEDEGDAFRQVVKNITHFEDSKHSQADNNTEKSQSTEVDIKGLEVSSKEVGAGNLETSDSGVGFNTSALPLDTDTDVADQIPDSEAVSISFAHETKASPPRAAETKPSAPPPPMELKPSPVAERKPSPVAETKPSPPPETKKAPDQPAEPKLDVPKPADTKPSPVPSPDPKPSVGLDVKMPEPKLAPSPSPEPKPFDFLAPSPKTSPSLEPKPIDFLAPSPKTTAPPTPEPKAALTPTPEPPKATTPEPVPISNGTPEPAPESKPADVIESSTPKAAPAFKTPEVELNSGGPALEATGDAPASNDSALAEDITTT